jgi:hypothetical protein
LPFWKVRDTVAYVDDVTPMEARAALGDAKERAAQVRETDTQFRWILLVLAGIDLAAAVLVGLVPEGRSPFAGITLLVVFVGGFLAGLILLLRARAYSRRGILFFTWSCAAFTWWNAAVVGVSVATHWWGLHQPATHFSVSAIIAAIPLLVAAWLVGRWR